MRNHVCDTCHVSFAVEITHRPQSITCPTCGSCWLYSERQQRVALDFICSVTGQPFSLRMSRLLGARKFRVERCDLRHDWSRQRKVLKGRYYRRHTASVTWLGHPRPNSIGQAVSSKLRGLLGGLVFRHPYLDHAWPRFETYSAEEFTYEGFCCPCCATESTLMIGTSGGYVACSGAVQFGKNGYHYLGVDGAGGFCFNDCEDDSATAVHCRRLSDLPRSTFPAFSPIQEEATQPCVVAEAA